MLGLKLNHVSKRGPSCEDITDNPTWNNTVSQRCNYLPSKIHVRVLVPFWIDALLIIYHNFSNTGQNLQHLFSLSSNRLRKCIGIMRRYTQYNVPHEIWTQLCWPFVLFWLYCCVYFKSRNPFTFILHDSFIGYGACICVIVLVTVK